MESDAGTDAFDWLLGTGEARGIALVFLISGLLLAAAGAAAFFTRSY